MIILKSLEWSDAFSYGKNNKISFIDSKLTQIVGKNGFGKSSIPLILEEGLFNKNSKGVKKGDILNRYSGAKAYSIGVEFEKDGDVYVIKTNRGATQKVSLSCNGEDISSHTATGTYKAIGEILGFQSTELIYQSSALSMEFLTATDTKRKQFLVELLNLGKYTKAFEVFKELAKEVSISVSNLETKISTIQSWIDKNSKVSLVKVDLKETPIYDTDYEAEKAKVELELANINKTNKEISTNNQYAEILSNIELDLDAAQPESIKPYIEQQAEYQAHKKTATSVITKMSTLHGTCPTCLQKIDSDMISKLLSENREIVEDADKAIATISKTIDKLNKDMVRYNKAVKASEEFEKYNGLYDNTKTKELLDAIELKTKIISLSTQIDSVKNEIKNIIDFNNKASAKNAEIDVISSQLVSMQEDLSATYSELLVVSDRLATLEILKKAFSTNGLLTYKIECLVKDLEDITNEYLTDLSSGRFVLSFKVVADKLNVIISDNGIDVGIESLSSGEKSRVNTATLLAIRKLMQALSTSKVNLLILDETLENLDIEGKEKLVEILFNEPDLNTFLISHSYTHPLLEKIVIVKENNISRIE